MLWLKTPLGLSKGIFVSFWPGNASALCLKRPPAGCSDTQHRPKFRRSRRFCPVWNVKLRRLDGRMWGGAPVRFGARPDFCTRDIEFWPAYFCCGCLMEMGAPPRPNPVMEILVRKQASGCAPYRHCHDGQRPRHLSPAGAHIRGRDA